MKANPGTKKYNGDYDEYLLGSIEVYEMVAKMCKLSDKQKMKGIVVMFDKEVLTYYATHLK